MAALSPPSFRSRSYSYSSSVSKNGKFLSSPPSRRKPSPAISALKIGAEEISHLIHNKPLVAATIASAIGQLAKPLTSGFRGNGFDLKLLIRPGGMPSTHSASVVAAATSLGLERGFSDSIFGMSVVFAALVMYDAQGVRREAGKHAQILNKIMKAQEESPINSSPASSLNSTKTIPLLTLSEKANSYMSASEPYSSQDSREPSRRVMPSLEVDREEKSGKIYINHIPLNETVGHTEIQVLIGALLGFVVSVIVDMIL